MSTASARPLVWIVDDSPLEAEVSRRPLAPRYDVEVFHDAALLLERFAVTKPAVIVADWYMPGVSGRELCQFIRQTHDKSTLPILVITGVGKRDDMLAALAAGANDFVFKPFDSEELSARVATLADVMRSNREMRLDAEFRERFMAILAHDLRQPLNMLTMSAGVWRQRELSPADAKIVGHVWSATQRMHRMIADLLDLTRSRIGGGIPIVPREMNFREICAEVVEELLLAHPTTSITLRASGDGGGIWDRDRIAQVCANLIGNAIQHGQPDAPVLVTLDGNEKEVVLVVENRGQAISAEEQSWIFDPFRRKTGSRAGASSGLGLGLYIVQQIVLAHRGSIALVSENQVTRFSVTLPSRVSEAAVS
jgi:signal transduction histidine kinase